MLVRGSVGVVGFCRWLFVVGDVVCWLVAVLEKIVKVGIVLCWLGVILEPLVLEKLEMCWSKLEVFVGLCRWSFVVGNVLCWLVAMLEKSIKVGFIVFCLLDKVLEGLVFEKLEV